MSYLHTGKVSEHESKSPPSQGKKHSPTSAETAGSTDGSGCPFKHNWQCSQVGSLHLSLH